MLDIERYSGRLCRILRAWISGPSAHFDACMFAWFRRSLVILFACCFRGRSTGAILESRIGAVHADVRRCPPLPMRLMAGLASLKSAISPTRLCANAGSRLFSAIPWRGVFPAQAATRPLLLDAVTAADGRGAGSDSGEPVGHDAHWRGEIVRLLQGDRSPNQKRSVTEAINRELRRCSAFEPVIGHLKAEQRMA